MLDSEETAAHQLMANLSAEQELESSVLDQTMNMSSIDVNQSTSIRSSRRRVKGSAVVLNTDRLQKYIRKDRPDVSRDDQSTHQHDREIRSSSMMRQLPTETVRLRALIRLQRWWKRYSLTRLRNYMQAGVWEMQTAHKMFAVFLGFRVRKLLKLKSIQLNIKAQQDIKRILTDMCNSMEGYMGGWERFRAELASEAVDDLLLRYPNLTHSDLTLAKSMSKQLLMERNKLYTLIFQGSIWRQFPPPGYWDIAAALLSASHSAHRSHVGASPARKLPSHKNSNNETPPSVRRAVKQSSSGSKPKPLDVYMNKHSSYAAQENSRPHTAGGGDLSQLPAHKQRDRQSHGSQETPETVHLRHSNDRAERVIEPQLLSTPEHSSSAAAASRGHHSTPGAHSSAAASSSSNAMYLAGGSSAQKAAGPASSAESSPQAKRHRDSQRGHLQLHVLSAEKLMAAKKGAPVRDSLGGAVPDRIPCLKVRFSLPNWTPGAGGRNQPSPDPASQALRKVYEKTRDFTVVTLNPQWGAAFIINLPCPRNIVQSLAYNEARHVYHPEEPLSDAAYEIVSRGLLQWWALGTVNVEVFDGERFNEDIFMGYIDLLLSGFMVLIKKPDELEIKGSFQLNKLKSSDRVSGSVKIHAFLHPPEKSYIAELLDPNPRTSVQQSQQDVLSAEKAPAGRGSRPASAPPPPAEEDPPAPPSVLSRYEEGSPPSSSSHTSRSSPEASAAPAVTFSSKFMQSLVRNSQYLIGITSPTAAESGAKAAEKESPEDSGVVRNESPVKKQAQPAPEAERAFREPQLEETENIHFNAQTGLPVSQQNIAQSARLLKEKVRQAKHQRRPRGAATASAAQAEEQTKRAEEDSLAQNVTLTEFNIKAEPPQRRQPPRKAAEREVVKASVSDQQQGRKEQSVESSEQRRTSMLDISKRLAGLSAVQHSTNVVLDSLNYKLEAKLRSRDVPERTRHAVPEDILYPDNDAEGEGEGEGEGDEGSDSEDAPYHSAQEGVADDADDTFDEPEGGNDNDEYDYIGDNDQDAFALPGTAEIREALQSSFRSSVEDNDAPEMGGDTQDNSENNTEDTRSYEEYGADEDQNFDDTYDDDDEEEGEGYDDAEQHYSQLDERSPHRNHYEAQRGAVADSGEHDAHPQHVVGSARKGRGMFEDDENSRSSSDGSDSEDQAEEVPVVRAVRNHTNLVTRDQPHPQHQQAFVQRPGGPQVRPPPPPPPPPLPPKTIYAEEEPDNEGADVMDGTTGANYSTESSVYSTNIQDFLSPDAHHSRGHRGNGSATNSHYFDADEEPEEPEELIVISSSGPSTRTSGYDGSPRRPFEVQSASDMQYHEGSPSRSLFDARDGGDELPGRQRAPRLVPNGRNAQNRDDSVVSSPGDGPPQCVVLELDDLEL